MEICGIYDVFRHLLCLALYQGTTFSRAVKSQTELGFSPCAFFRPNTCNCRGTARQIGQL
jgi:hypothetical protein